MPPARMCGLAATGSLVSRVLLPRRPPHRLRVFCHTRGISMPRIVRCGVIQTHCEWSPEKHSLADIKEKMIAKHERLIADAAKKKVQILGLQELFYGPYFCAEQQTRWYELTERVPDGPTISLMQKLAKKYQMVLVVPVYEVEMTGVYFNTAAVID